MPPTSPADDLTIGELSSRSGVARSALRYYEDLGLIAASRTSGNQRRYPRHMLRRVALLSVAKELGIPLSDVRQTLGQVPMDRTPTQAEWQLAARAWRQDLQQRRARLERLERELTGCIGCGCLSMRACWLLNPDDELSASGPGARRLELSSDEGAPQTS